MPYFYSLKHQLFTLSYQLRWLTRKRNILDGRFRSYLTVPKIFIFVPLLDNFSSLLKLLLLSFLFFDSLFFFNFESFFKVRLSYLDMKYLIFWFETSYLTFAFLLLIDFLHHFIGPIVPPGSLYFDSTSVFVQLFWIIFFFKHKHVLFVRRLLVAWSGCLFGVLHIVLFSDNCAKINSHWLFGRSIEFFTVLRKWAFAPNFGCRYGFLHCWSCDG